MLVTVNVMTGLVAFWQTAVVPEIEASGNGLTITAALPDCALLHVFPVMLSRL